MDPRPVTEEGCTPGLVERRPEIHAVPEGAGDGGGALDLLRGRGHSPQEPVRKAQASLASIFARGVEADGVRHPLTPPSMIPPTICFPSSAKTTSRGTVPTSVPARMMERSGT